MKLFRLLPVIVGFSLAGPGVSFGQAVRLPPPDQDGWIKLFRGDNTADFYARLRTNINTDVAFPNPTFKVMGDTIQTTGSPTGHLAFKQVFSHYHFKMEMMIPAQTNCGLLLHIREDEEKMAEFPRSVECQGDPSQGQGELWTISKVWVNVKVKRGVTAHTYDPNGDEVTHGSNNFDNSRVCHQSENKYKGHGQWNLFEAIVRGSDSVSHLINGTRVMHYTKLRIENDMSKPLNSGRIAVQAEGSTANYRNLYIRLLPGDPLYTATYANFFDRNTIKAPLHQKSTLIDNDFIVFRMSGKVGESGYDLGGRRLRILPVRKK